MRSNKKYGTGVALAATAGALALIAVSATGASAEGEFTNTPASADTISSTVRKTVSVTANAEGKVSNSIMITQVSSNGKGQTTVNVPVGADSARNLDSFGGTVVKDGNAVFDMNLNGSQESRVMTTTDPGPIEISAEASLDGQPIEPDQVVNKTGVLKVKYTVVNKEKQVVEVAVRGEDGNTTMEEQEVDAPIGGSVAITLPQGFNEISAPGANIGGNGQGGSSLSYSLVMFKPLGDPVATVEYESRITDGTLPEAVFTMLPIVPLENSTIATAKSSFGTGVTTGETIAGAGKQIGDGAGQLATGIGTAADGASQLAAGITGTLEPGANQLADGITGTLQPGANKLADGITGTLQPGANELADGVTGTLQPGANTLAESLGAFQSAVEGIEGTVTGSDEYKEQMVLLNTVLGGLVSQMNIVYGYQGDIDDNAGNVGSTAITAAVTKCATEGWASAPDCQAALQPAIATAITPLITDIITDAKTSEAILKDGPLPAPAQPALTLLAGLQALLPSVVPGVLEQVTASLLGTTNCKDSDPKSGKALKCIVAGSNKLAGGINDTLAPGAQQLASGINDTLAPGAQQLADGINDTLAPGAQQLADGITDTLAPGAQQLAAGLPAAVDGADKLSAGGKELATKGNEAAAGFGNQVNQIDAVQQLGVAGVGIPHGKATGENVTTTGAYQLTLAAAKTPEQNNALRFGLAAVALLAAIGIGTAVARKKSAS